VAEDLVKAIRDCRKRAAEFKQEARKAWLPSRRRYFFEMADCWLVLARDYQIRLNLQRSLFEFNEPHRSYASIANNTSNTATH
jgi:hypothetical protein